MRSISTNDSNSINSHSKIGKAKYNFYKMIETCMRSIIGNEIPNLEKADGIEAKETALIAKGEMRPNQIPESDPGLHAP